MFAIHAFCSVASCLGSPQLILCLVRPNTRVTALATLRSMLILRIAFTAIPSTLGIVGGRMGPILPPRGATAQIIGDVVFYGLLLAVFVGVWCCRRWARTTYVVLLRYSCLRCLRGRSQYLRPPLWLRSFFFSMSSMV